MMKTDRAWDASTTNSWYHNENNVYTSTVDAINLNNALAFTNVRVLFYFFF